MASPAGTSFSPDATLSIFHSIPRYDTTFTRVTSTFSVDWSSPSGKAYSEAIPLLILCSAPLPSFSQAAASPPPPHLLFLPPQSLAWACRQAALLP
jgi:hypothetical protein